MKTSFLRLFFTLWLRLGQGGVDPAMPSLTEERASFAGGVGAVL